MNEHQPEQNGNYADNALRYKTAFSIRFKGNKKAYTFGTNQDGYLYGDFVVVETIRGIELGEIISEARETATIDHALELKPILRKATRDDLANFERNKDLAKEAIVKCTEAIRKCKLDMNLISAEYTLDRSKVIFVYVADERVDFRDLLKELAQVLKCRIELRQIGPRDKAKIIGGLGPCGMETCCSRFLNDFDVVSINMAKNQLLALNIQKLSGQCGKLMCCLKYEDGNYKQLRKGCPKLNEQIDYNNKRFRVTSMNLLTRQAKLENREETLFLDFDEAFKDRVVTEDKKDDEK
jgi:cell fate regulator YaaT (PSP1 superfamily)